MEQAADGGPDGLRVVEVHGGVGEHHGVGPGRVGGAQHGAGVPGVADVGQHGDQLRPGGQHLGERGVDEATEGDDALRGHGVADPGDHLVRGGEHRQPLGQRGLDDPGVPFGGLDRGVHLDDGMLVRTRQPPERDGLAHGLRALDEEAALLAALAALGEPPGGDDARRTQGGEQGRVGARHGLVSVLASVR